MAIAKNKEALRDRLDLVDVIGVFNISWGFFAAMGAGNLIVRLFYR